MSGPKMTGMSRVRRHKRNYVYFFSIVLTASLVAGSVSAKNIDELRPFEPSEFSPGSYNLEIHQPVWYGMAIRTDPDSPACQDTHQDYIRFYHADIPEEWILMKRACRGGFTNLERFNPGAYRVEVGGTGRWMIIAQHSVDLETGESPSTIQDTFTRRVAHWFDGSGQNIRVTVQASSPVRAWVYDWGVNLVEDLGSGRKVECICDFQEFESVMLYVVLESSSDEAVHASITVLSSDESGPTPLSPGVILYLAVAAGAGVGIGWWWMGSKRT